MNKKTSRLAVLGELGRYPLSHCINYKSSLLGPSSQQSTLLHDVVQEMKKMTSSGYDCWLSRVNNIQNLLNLPDTPRFKRLQGKKCTVKIKNMFDRFWLDSLNSLGTNTATDRNKLRTYRTFKASFTREPYIDLVKNRNQRTAITRLRTGSHLLNIETGRWTRPVTPVEHRTCPYCAPTSTATSSPGPRPPPTPAIDDEYHFLINCSRFKNVRAIAFEDISLQLPFFSNLPKTQQFRTLLCPTKATVTKIVNRLIRDMFQLREKIDNNP